jgi:type II secretory ATPase GspE/PulE/Tfp pilus assembly ATPase PilB-like protein
MALFEQFVPDDRIKQLIVDRVSAMDMDETLRKSDMLTLERAGKLAALEGQTTMEELVRVLPMV